MAFTFEDFIITVPAEQQGYVTAFHEDMTDLGCTLVIKEAKSGYVVSYQLNKKTIMNWVFRKSGMVARIYGDHVGEYASLVAALPESMVKKMTGARDCKRLMDPAACSPTCVQGFIYELGGEVYKKCRNDGMFFPLTDESGPHIQALVTAEIGTRQ